MHEVRLYELTDAYRTLETIKKPNVRIKAAKEKLMEHILSNVETLQRWQSTPAVPRK